MTSLLSGFTFLAAWACDHFKWDWSGALTRLVKKCINCSVELPSAVTVAKVTTGLSVLGFCLSAMLEARYGVRATIMNAKILGPHQVYCRELEIAGLQVSMYYPAEGNVPADRELCDWLGDYTAE